MKDMPARLPDGLTMAALLPREDVRDAFLSPVAKIHRRSGEGCRRRLLLRQARRRN